jgi:LysR family transcriptional regulator of gallate degradation
VSEFYTPPSELIEQLQSLPIFVSVAEERSIMAAAKQLFKAPSAITRSVIDLERSVGSVLFERRPRGMLLNIIGEAVLARAMRIICEINDAAESFVEGSMSIRSGVPSAVRSVLFNGRKLQLLTIISELRNISSAAVQLGMTQAGASMALARMEDMVGQPLFHRRIEGMVATEATEQLVVHARRVFAELRHMSSDIAALTGSISGQVVIGSTPLGRTPPFTSAIDEATRRWPGVKVTTIENSYEMLIRDLRSGEIDFVLGVLRPPHLSLRLETEALFDDRLSALVGRGHRLTDREKVTMADLATERLILPRPNSLARPVLDDAFREAGLGAIEPTVQTGDQTIIRQLLVDSDMVAITSPFQLMFEIQAGTVCELPIHLPGASRTVGLLHRTGALLSPAASALMEVVRTKMQQPLPAPSY